MPKHRPGTKIPKLQPLPFGCPYCELCKTQIQAGERAAWWRVPGRGRRTRWAVYCATCHHANVRQRRPLQ
jgi:hypothetical protein